MKNNGDFYCLNCLHSFRIENKLKSYEKVRKSKIFCEIVLPSQKNKILEFNQCMKSDKMLYIIYTDIESLIKKNDEYANNSEKSLTTKIGKYIPGGFSMSTIWEYKTSIIYIA